MDFDEDLCVECEKKQVAESVRVMCIEMKDDPFPIEYGQKGTVKHVDSMNQIHVSWECGSSLALIPGKDRFTVLD